MELLASYPAVEFVRVTLSALSTLASATLIDIPEQVVLLLRYLQDDPRLSIKRHALHLLHALARRGAHLWPQGALNNLIGKFSRGVLPLLINIFYYFLFIQFYNKFICI